MCNLDRFSSPMTWEWKSRDSGPDFTEYQPPVLCACGCKQEIFLDDEQSYIESEFWSDELVLNEPEHIEKYLKKNDQLVGSQSI